VEPFDGSPDYHRIVAGCLPCRLLMRFISSPRRALILNGKQFKRGQADHAAFPAGNMKVFKWPHSSSSSPCRAMSRYGAIEPQVDLTVISILIRYGRAHLVWKAVVPAVFSIGAS
jgi:hypothetical protein